MLTNKIINEKVIPKLKRLRKEGYTVYIPWCGKNHRIERSNQTEGIRILPTSDKEWSLKLDAKFFASEGVHTLDHLEQCFRVELTLKDFQ